MADKDKKVYQEPKLTKWGTVADLTKTGNSFPRGDAKGGSRPSRGV